MKYHSKFLNEILNKDNKNIKKINNIKNGKIEFRNVLFKYK